METVELTDASIKILKDLQESKKRSVPELEKEGFDQSMVHRAALELENEGLIEYSEDVSKKIELTDEGEKVVEEGSPEYRLAKLAEKERLSVEDVQSSFESFNAALGNSKNRGWVEIEDGKIVEGSVEIPSSDPVAEELDNKENVDKYIERGLLESKEVKTRSLEITEKGREVDFSDVKVKFDVESRTSTPRTGKKHFYKEIRKYARQVWLEMGFKEMRGDFIEPGFTNFDALNIPQDHPARDLQDTFFMEKPKYSDLSEFGDKVEEVKEIHENGGSAGGRGWKYDWQKEQAERNVLRTHTTAVSARKLHEIDVSDEKLPQKYFVVGRNFRNETVDRTHLAGFYQTDGIVIGENLNFKNLRGYIQRFFRKMGFPKVRMIPTYYPYTEMSMEVQVWDEVGGEWMGMGGSGMFRPEVVKPMLGRDVQVLAWGLGIPRIAMKQAELEDLRELYRNDIELIEETEIWRPNNFVDEAR